MEEAEQEAQGWGERERLCVCRAPGVPTADSDYREAQRTKLVGGLTPLLVGQPVACPRSATAGRVRTPR